MSLCVSPPPQCPRPFQAHLMCEYSPHAPTPMRRSPLSSSKRGLCYILSTSSVLVLSSVKKTSRLPFASIPAATPINAEPLPVC